VHQAGTYELLEPIDTDRGVFVVEILNKNDTTQVSLSNQQKNRNRMTIYNKFYRSQGDTIYKNLSEKFSSELGGKIFDSGIDEFLLAIKAWEATPNPTDQTFTEAQRLIILGKIADITLTAGYFIDEFQGTFRTSYQRFNSHEGLQKVLKDYIERYLAWITKAKEAGIDKLPDIQKIFQDFLDAKLVELFDKYEIREKAVPTEEEKKEFFETNKGDFTDPKKIRIWEIAIKDEKTAQTVLKKANTPGTDFSALAQEYTEKIHLRDRKGDLGYQSIKSPRKIIKSAFEAGENKVIGPIKEQRFYCIIKTGDILPERQKEYKEVESHVKSRAQRKKEQKIKEELSNRLEKRYNIWIDESKLKELS
jgi:peptidyl-prolyl cis-trans isomerase C